MTPWWQGVDGWQGASELAQMPPRQGVGRPPTTASRHPGAQVRASRALTDPLQLGDNVFDKR